MTELTDRLAIDQSAFEQLRADLDDDQACGRFLQSYLDLLPVRVCELVHALNDGDLHPWEAAMNLASTSRMIGALPMARHLERLTRDSILTESPEAMRVFSRQLVELARQLQPVLRCRIQALGGSAGRRRSGGG